MTMNILHTIYATDPRRRLGKRYTSGTVLSVGGGKVTLDVGATLPSGAPVTLELPASGSFSPAVGQAVQINYPGDSFHAGSASPMSQSAGGGSTPTAVDHGALIGLADDDHAQYHTDARGDSRYYRKTEHLASSAGAGDAGKPIKLDAGGKVDASMIDDSDIDHGSVGGLADDDHAQYHNDSRGDARYYQKTELDGGQLDNRYYRENEHINASTGVADAAKPILTDARGKLAGSFINPADIDHNSLTNLATGNVHTQYLLRSGGTLTGNVSCNAGVTIDGVDVDSHRTRHDYGGADALTTVPNHDHTGDAGDGAKIAGLSALSDVTQSGGVSKVLATDADGHLVIGSGKKLDGVDVSAHDHSSSTDQTRLAEKDRVWTQEWFIKGPFTGGDAVIQLTNHPPWKTSKLVKAYLQIYCSQTTADVQLSIYKGSSEETEYQCLISAGTVAYHYDSEEPSEEDRVQWDPSSDTFRVLLSIGFGGVALNISVQLVWVTT